MSRAKSPASVRPASNSPLRLITKQNQNSSINLNAHALSNAKHQLITHTQHSHSHVSPTMREHTRSPVDYMRDSAGGNIHDYQVHLKLTDKYAQRFGMNNENAAANESSNYNLMSKSGLTSNYAHTYAVGNSYMPDSRLQHQPLAYTENQEAPTRDNKVDENEQKYSNRHHMNSKASFGLSHRGTNQQQASDIAPYQPVAEQTD